MRSLAGAAELTPARLREAPVHWPRPGALAASLEALDGVGPKWTEIAREAGISNLEDLLLRVPRGHRERIVSPIAELEPGDRATIVIEVLGGQPRPFRRGGLSIVSVKVGDDSGSLRASWFNQPWVARKLVPGARLLLTGSRDKRGFRVSEHEFHPWAEGLVPVHPGTDQLSAARIRQWVEQAIPLARNLVEPLPAELRARRGLPGIADAVRAVHFPESEGETELARERLKFEELFLYQALLATRKSARRSSRPAPRLGRRGELVGRWLGSLPFDLTPDQLRAFGDVDGDLDSGEPMQRLLMGEVGSGKTVVALYAMLRALESGFQAALMAPTETLAEQHAATLDRLLGAEAIPFSLLTGATPAAVRRDALDKLASGELGLVLGTHSLIEPAVRFARLGVCIVDEQHRFGVEQRRALDSKGVEGMAPHVLHMTATPIPRTLSLTVYGDLDMTALRQLPAGRKPIETRLVEDAERPPAYEFLREQLREGRQAYVVCPLVSESEKLQGKAAEAEAARLASGELAGFSVGVLHGQMPAAAKAETMAAFAAGETSVLVATTVIEVGIDVANATVMVIEGAERYGVSQLHQLRGRVGRGEHESHCLLFPGSAGETARRRLRAVVRERDGFALAEVDLALRGEGEALGTRQHGLPRFEVAELPDDAAVLSAAREEVLELLRAHGSLTAPDLGPLLDAARARFGATDSIPL